MTRSDEKIEFRDEDGENELSMRDIPDWATYLDAGFAGFHVFAPPNEIGEKNVFGQTLIGWIDIDEEARDAALSAWREESDRLDAIYREKGFRRHEDAWIPDMDEEEYFDLESKLDELWWQYCQLNQRKPIYDPPQVTMTWGDQAPLLTE